MSAPVVTPLNLFPSQLAPIAAAVVYTVPGSTTAIIDKFTATNSDASTHTITVYLIPSGGSAGVSNTVISAFSLTAGLCKDFTELQNQILAPGDSIAIVSDTASFVVVRGSGRQVK